jgi:hypothetical protein
MWVDSASTSSSSSSSHSWTTEEGSISWAACGAILVSLGSRLTRFGFTGAVLGKKVAKTSNGAKTLFPFHSSYVRLYFALTLRCFDRFLFPAFAHTQISDPMVKSLIIGSLNLTHARGKMTNLTDPDVKAPGRRKFADICDILTLVDTKSRVENISEYQPSNQHHTTSESAVDGKMGIMILTRKSIHISEYFETPSLLRGRGLAIEISIPTEAGPCLSMVIIVIYAPD